MSNPIIKIHNTETDEVIEREMTDSEFEDYKAAIQESVYDEQQAALKDK